MITGTGVAGSVVSGFAAPSASATGSSAPLGLGLKLGATMKDAGGRLVDIVAKATGLSATDVQAKRADGQSFAAIASAKGVSSAKLVSSALSVRKAALDKAVADGKITQAQADAAYARMQSRLTDRVSSTQPCTGNGAGQGGGGCGMGRGAGGGGNCGGNCGGANAPTQ